MSQPDFQAEREERLKEQITQISDDLNSVASEDSPVLRERIFVGVFLPYFAGDENRPYPKADAAMWVHSVAGSAYKEVKVIDHENRLLFMVPPLMDRSAVSPAADANGRALPSIAHVVHSAQQYTQLSPRQGAAYLQEELNRRALVMKVPAAVLAHVEAWNKIFERYGRPPLLALEQPAAAQASASDPQAPSDPGYEMDLL